MASVNGVQKGDLPPSINSEHNTQTMDTKSLGREVLRDIFHNSYRYDQEPDSPINKKLKTVYLREFKTLLTPSKQAPYLALGGPGEGKTSTFRAAAEKFTKLMGLDFIDTRTVDPLTFNPGPNDFLWAQLELGGEISSVTTTGAPVARQNANNEDVVIKSMNAQLALLKRASFSMFSLDDIANASTPIISNVMPIVEEKGIQGHSFGSHLNLCLTGNIAGKDGSAANQLPSPLVSRCKSVDVYDKLSFFCERLYDQYYSQNYHDEVKDAGVIGFLLSNPDFFRDDIAQTRKDLGLKAKDTLGQFASPRTWRNCINAVRTIEAEYTLASRIVNGDDTKRQAHIDALLKDMGADDLSTQEKSQLSKEIVEAQRDIIRQMPEKLERAIKSSIGIHAVGGKFYVYTAQRLQLNTVEMAKEMMADGKLSKANADLFVNHYVNGNAEQAKNFGYAWTAELGKAASEQLVTALKDKDMARVQLLGTNFATGILAPVIEKDGKTTYAVQLDEGEVARSVNVVMQGLARAGLSQAYRGQTGQVVLSEKELIKPLIKGMVDAPTAKQSKGKDSKGKDILRVHVLSNLLTNSFDVSKTVQDLKVRLGELERLDGDKEIAKVTREDAHQAKQEIQDNQANEPAPAKQKSSEAGMFDSPKNEPSNTPTHDNSAQPEQEDEREHDPFASSFSL